VSELKKYMTDDELTGLAAAGVEEPSEASEAPARKAGE
jgi:hypothetical protein